MSKHFDGWGHIILSYMDMIKRYARDYPSLAVLRRFSSYGYVVMPDVQIIVKKRQSDELEVLLAWPGESRRFCKKCNDRRISALRRLYKSGDLSWRRIDLGEEIMFSRPGRIVRNVKAVDYGAASAVG